MRTRIDESTVGFGARIPAADKALFAAVLPMQGGQKWAIEAGLEEFITRCEASEWYVRRVKAAVDEMNMADPPRGLEQLLPRIRADLHNRFYKLFQEKGTVTWFIRNYVSAILAEYSGELPDDKIKHAVDRMLRTGEGTGEHP